MRYSATIAALLVGGLSIGSALAAEAPWRQFLDAHCADCHGDPSPRAGLSIAGLTADFQTAQTFESWVKIHDQLRSGEMPPSDHPQPPSEERDSLVEWLAEGLIEAEWTRRQGVGRAQMRRLNRTEYENTLRDLFQIPGLSVQSILPEDGLAFGFHKSAAGLDLSYVQLARYMDAAEVALDAAIAPHAEPPAYFKAHIFGRCQPLVAPAFNGETVFLKDFQYDPSIMPIPREKNGKSPEAQEIKRENLKSPRPGTMGVFRCEDESFKPQFPFHVVTSGRYRMRMSVWSFWWDKGEVKPSPRTEAASLVAEGRTLGYFDAPSLEPTVTEIEVWLQAEDRIRFDATSLRPVQIYNREGLAAEYRGAGIAVDWLEIEGPLLDQWPPVSHRRLFGDLEMVALPPTPKQRGNQSSDRLPAGGDYRNPKRPPDNAYVIKGHGKPFIENVESLPQHFENATVASAAPESDARRLLADFLPRAFRRPVAMDEVERYVRLFRVGFERGDRFEVAMRVAYQAALCAPDFLYLNELGGANPDPALDQWALASRLSYFLWNSMPDDELFDLAQRGKLSDSEVLRGQVERMLGDPKVERFIVDFTDQWLDLVDIDATTPDKKLYPEFRRILRDSMRAETPAFFRELLENDLSTSHIVHSDFAMLNQRLAEHYGIGNVVGTAFRPVTLPADSPRGGFLTQASVLKLTANGTVTSPVKRGAWVMRKILGRPPEPPPPNVPAIEPDVRGATTIRELLTAHRSDASCAECHADIDAPGFALENFDVIGGWQTRYRTLSEEGDPVDASETYFGHKVQYRWGVPVDASGDWDGDQAFEDIAEFKQLLLADRRLIAGNFVELLVTYSTGAPVTFADRAVVEEILRNTSPTQHGVRSIIHELVQSPLFQKK